MRQAKRIDTRTNDEWTYDQLRRLDIWAAGAALALLFVVTILAILSLPV